MTCNNDEFWVIGLPGPEGYRSVAGTAFSLHSGRLRSHNFLKKLPKRCYGNTAAEVFNKYADNQTCSFPWWIYNVTDKEHDGVLFYDMPRREKSWGVWTRALLYYDNGMEPWWNIQGLYSQYWWEIAQELPASIKFEGVSKEASQLMRDQADALCQRGGVVIVNDKKSIFAKAYNYYKKNGFKRTVKKVLSKLMGK